MLPVVERAAATTLTSAADALVAAFSGALDPRLRRRADLLLRALAWA